MLHCQPSIAKISAPVGWQPTRNLDEILADVVEHTRTAPAAVVETA
jgi:hypothetical protein